MADDDLPLQRLVRAALSGDPDRPAVRDAHRWYDWGWLRDTGRAMLDLLEPHSASARPIGLVARNRPTIVAALLALLSEGRCVRMLYAHQSSRMLADQIAEGTIGALIAADDDMTQQVVEAAQKANIRALAVHEEIGVGLASDGDSEPEEGRAASGTLPGPYIEVLTSGTTGEPRPFRIPYDMILRRLLSMNVTYPASSAVHSGDTVSLLFYPLGTISGIYSYLPPALDGHRVILQEKFEIEGWLRYIDRYRPVRSSLPPFGIETLLARNVTRASLAGLQFIGTGSAPLDLQTQIAFEEHFAIPLLVSYGATEFGGPVAAMTSQLWREWGAAKRGSAGRAWAGARLRIVDPLTGRERPRGTEGVLEVIAPGTLSEAWERTSDLAIIDADDFLYHRGRADGAITRGGFSILPEVIERAIASHPDVLAAAVVGLANPRLGEVPVAAIKPRFFDSPPEIAALEAHLRDRLFATHIPKQFRFVRELPMNPSMKVQLSKVRALFERKARHE